MNNTLRLCAVLILWALSAKGQTDLTRVADSYGPLVVETTVKLLRDACLINDHFFLRRIASFETNDGLALLPADHGGIWKVDEEMFNYTQSGTPILQNIYRDVFNKLFVVWKGITWKELNKPLFSGLAAAIYLKAKTNETIPLSKPGQAKFWKKYFRTNGNEQAFLTAMQAMPEGCSVPTQVDLTFIVETSSNVNSAELRQTKNFIARIINGLVVSSSKVQVAVVTYGSQANVSFHLNSYSNKIDVVSHIDSMPLSGGSVATSKALKLTREEVFVAKNGARVGAAQVAILITKSPPDNKTKSEIESSVLTGSDVTLFTIAIGSTVNSNDLNKISSQPNCVHYTHIDNFLDLEDLAAEMDEAICRAPVKLSSGRFTHPCNVDALLSIPDNPYGTTIKISVGAGSRTLYTSFMFGQPNTAKNDLAATVDNFNPLTLYLHDNNPSYHISMKSVLGLICMDNYTIDVQVGPPSSVSPDTICIEQGIKKDCSNVTMNTTPATSATPGTSATSVPTTSTAPSTPAVATASTYQTTPNICVGNITVAQHPNDPTKFLMCDIKGQLLTVQCPHKELFCAATNLCEAHCPSTTTKLTQSTTPIVSPTSLVPATNSTSRKPIIIIVFTTGPPVIMGSRTAPSNSATTTIPNTKTTFTNSPVRTTRGIPTTTTLQKITSTNSVSTTTHRATTNQNCHQNPCTVHAFMNNNLYFPACDEHEYYQCLGINSKKTVQCPPDKIFNPDILNCVNEFVFNEETQAFDKTIPNPCKNTRGDLYFVHPTDKSKFIHCDGFWNGFMRTCPSGEIFHEMAQSCIMIVSSAFGK
ncbi:mucin-5AC-like [Saccostrea cucullata]|uniref:mucin-5AC-like n=1 Tax=Saccostrea cuccullata TaxID=36930 RepID=UPI002ED14F75